MLGVDVNILVAGELRGALVTSTGCLASDCTIGEQKGRKIAFSGKEVAALLYN